MAETKDHTLPVLAIDLGGTKVMAAIISSKGEVMAREYHRTRAREGPKLVLKRICSVIDHLLEANGMALSQLDGISIAAAGVIDMKRGLVTLSPNLSGWRDVPLRGIVQERYGIDTCLLNDASAAALGEHCLGAGRGVSNLIYLTVSTGIGGGIIIDDELYLGACGGAGEIGHMTIDVNGPRCRCGNIGCLEMLASGTAVAREAVRRIRGGERSSLAGMVAGKVENITAETVEMAARNGDSLAAEIITNAATCLGVGLVNLVNIFNPEMIVIGGGMAKAGELLLAPARAVVRERAFSLAAQAVRIVPAQLGDETGVLGAAMFAFHQQGQGRQDEGS